MKWLLSITWKLIFRLMGWKMEPLPPYFYQKHVIIGFPHTSNMDTVIAFTGFRVLKKKGHIMIKKEWFFWPMSIFLNILGGIPVSRNASLGAVEQMAKMFQQRNEFLLAIVPEGTRKNVTTIKTGFWHIAKKADVSIICWYLDNKKKTARWLGEVIPGENIQDDLLKIQHIYGQAGYALPFDSQMIRENSNPCKPAVK